MKVLTCSLFILAWSSLSSAYYDDDITVVEACEYELEKKFGSEFVGIFDEVADEVEERKDVQGNIYYYLSNNDAICTVSYTDNGTIENVEVVFAD